MVLVNDFDDVDAEGRARGIGDDKAPGSTGLMLSSSSTLGDHGPLSLAAILRFFKNGQMLKTANTTETEFIGSTHWTTVGALLNYAKGKSQESNSKEAHGSAIAESKDASRTTVVFLHETHDVITIAHVARFVRRGSR
ncbi:hypothetical protein Dimus_037624 [Dionaea muscipula]